jgi:hypothetical protein
LALLVIRENRRSAAPSTSSRKPAAFPIAPTSNVTAPLSQISAALGIPRESEITQVGMSVSPKCRNFAVFQRLSSRSVSRCFSLIQRVEVPLPPVKEYRRKWRKLGDWPIWIRTVNAVRVNAGKPNFPMMVKTEGEDKGGLELTDAGTSAGLQDQLPNTTLVDCSGSSAATFYGSAGMPV